MSLPVLYLKGRQDTHPTRWIIDLLEIPNQEVLVDLKSSLRAIISKSNNGENSGRSLAYKR